MRAASPRVGGIEGGPLGFRQAQPATPIPGPSPKMGEGSRSPLPFVGDRLGVRVGFDTLYFVALLNPRLHVTPNEVRGLRCLTSFGKTEEFVGHDRRGVGAGRQQGASLGLRCLTSFGMTDEFVRHDRSVRLA